ncbi:MAG: galactose ABC transporter substrate-binding protein [Lachnospiraceae bacterium]|jgi:methyl-galactoside transport system substrate-binding protein|nr:galactose ABC transporter substrate-binding protein [Lachnospiraceae bacterium]
MKKRIILAAAVLFVCTAAFLLTARSEKEGEQEAPKTSIRIGLLLYRGDDTFIGTLRSSIEECAKGYEQQTGIKVTLDVMDAKGSQNTQNSQVERLISLECDALCVNMVDRAAASAVIDKALAAGLPVIFFNREPVEEDMNRSDRLYYVGADAKESAVLQGKLLVDAYKNNPDSLDLNGDGKVSYVLLEGETSHQDSLIRTEWSIQTLKDGEVPIERITGGIANWERSQASALMEQWLLEYPGQIELAICNNDDMALGAIDAMERNGVAFGAIRLVGIDGTPAGQEALKAGKLLGTVESDREFYAKAIFEIAAALAAGEETGYEKYVWCPQRALTESNRR